jgi:hypothetical protein
MKTTLGPDSLELQQVLWACYDYWKAGSAPPDERGLCYTWVVRRYADRFGARFHPSRLGRLVQLGFLEKEEASRGGSRRYYRMVDAPRVADVLRELPLDRGRP